MNTNLDFFLKKLKTDSFYVSSDKAEIPTYIKKTFLCLVDKIANPGEEWQSTDMVNEDAAADPRRSLIFFAINKKEDIFVITYKRGGIGVSTITMMMKLTDNGIIVDGQKNVADLWTGQVSYEGKDIAGLLRYIEQYRYSDLNTNNFTY